MSKAKFATITGIIVALAATSAYAMTKVSDREAIYIGRSGSHAVVSTTDAGHENIMKQARPLEAGAVVYRSGGKLYLLEDRKMANGKMMFDSTENWYKQATGSIE